MRRRKAMRKLFLVALVVGVCAPTIMAQDAAKAGIYGGLQNLRYNALETSRQDVSNLPQTSKPAPLLTATPETGERYVNSLPFNSPAAGVAGGRGQCRGCQIGHTHVEIYGGDLFFFFFCFFSKKVVIYKFFYIKKKIYFFLLSVPFYFFLFVCGPFYCLIS